MDDALLFLFHLVAVMLGGLIAAMFVDIVDWLRS